jgi:glycosyltransferase involved in cell wall biosynthesis
MNNPLINVLMTTYNLEDYIKQSVESVLEQETEYVYNLIIVDDCSTDATVEIINDIIKNHPKGNYIELHQNEFNLGVVKNSKNAISLAKAPYIAMIDGDDYWISKVKLQKQCSFLELNPDYNSSCSLVQSYYENSGKSKIFIDGWHFSKKKTLICLTI